MARPAKLHRFARQIATKLARGKEQHLTKEMFAHLDEDFDNIFVSLDGIAKHLRHEGDEAEALAAAYLMLLSAQLLQLRYRIDRNYDWANELLEEFQRRLVSLARDGALPGQAMSAIASALCEAKLHPSPELVAVNEKLMEAEGSAETIPGDIDSLLGTIAAEHGNDVFSIGNSLAQVGHAMPTEFCSFLAAQMMECPLPAIREAAALTLLDPQKEIRRGVALSLTECADSLTPTALRRLIVIRNWLPEDERHLVDRVVRAARRKGIDCAPWGSGGTSEILATAIDGSGAHGFLAVSQEGRRHRLSSVLLKQAVGVVDAWSGDPSTKRKIAQTVEQAHNSTPLLAASRGYFDQAVCHHLAIGLDDGTVPPVGLIQVAETTGATDWQPAKLDWREEVDALVDQFPAELLKPSKVAEILRTSDEWAEVGGLPDSWFEDDQEVQDVLVKARTRQPEKLMQRILDGIIEKRKLKWAERFFWLALWLKEGPLEPELPWPLFIILARELADDRPVREIPLMEEIALTTVMTHMG